MKHRGIILLGLLICLALILGGISWVKKTSPAPIPEAPIPGKKVKWISELKEVKPAGEGAGGVSAFKLLDH